MTMIRPGGEALTKKAVALAELKEGDRVLDIGCGEGDTVNLLASEYGMSAVGIDASNKMLDRGRARFPGIDLQRMDSHAISFDSKTFDAVFMECSLSVLRLQEDTCFEAYCLLKPGGKLIISDIYVQNPDPERVAAMLRESQEKAAKPKEHESCGDNDNPSFIMLDGAIVADELHGMLTDLGFTLKHFEEVPHALSNFAAQAVMGYGSLEEYFKAQVPEGEDPSAYCACEAYNSGNTLGYFLMILEK